MIEMPPEDPDAQLERIRNATLTFSEPAGFDRARPEESQEWLQFGFPPRPDEAMHKELHDFWVQMFTEVLVYETIQLSLALPRELLYPEGGAADTRTHHEGSINWSGAYVTPRDGLIWTDIVGSWYVPTVVPPAGWPTGAMYGSSTWIGLDGQRSYLHSTLPQVGTGQFLNLPGMPGSTTVSWVQWWPQYPYSAGIPVVPGDYMMAWLRVLSPTYVLFILVNYSRRRLAAFIWPAPMVTMPPLVPAPVQAIVSGATAEWVTERPAIVPFPTLFNLPNYGTVTFENCFALAAPAPLSAYTVRNVANPWLIRMYRRARNPRRTATTSRASRVSATRVRTSFVP